MPQPIRANEHYAQRDQIAGLFGYRLWAETDRAEVAGKAGVLARRDVTATFILTELLALLTARRIVRPGYTTLQAIIGEVLMAERRRLEHLVEGALDKAALPLCKVSLCARRPFPSWRRSSRTPSTSATA